MHHTHINTVFYAAICAHPLEHVFCNIAASVIGPLILGKRMHVMAAMFFWFGRNCESLEGHCGYEFSWSPFRWVPFSTPYGYHTFHHSVNIGNYSSAFHIWDTVFGSNKVYNNYLKDFKKEYK